MDVSQVYRFITFSNGKGCDVQKQWLDIHEEHPFPFYKLRLLQYCLKIKNAKQ